MASQAICIKELCSKDFPRAMQYCSEALQFKECIRASLLDLYTKSFWYEETTDASLFLGAYAEDELLGILIASFKDEEKPYHTWLNRIRKAVLGCFFFIADSTSRRYERANKRLLKRFREKRDRKSVDGRICLFVVSPQAQGKGVGSRLMDELRRKYKDAYVYLFTDNLCTFGYYDTHGFTREAATSFSYRLSGHTKRMDCFLYTKQL